MFFAFINQLKRERHFQANHEENNTQTKVSPIRGIFHLSRLAKIFNIMMIMVYIYIISKYSLLAMLNYSFMKPYKYLDCYILGRMIFDGRTTRATRIIMPAVSLMFLANRAIILYFRPKFRFHMFEFMLIEPDEVRLVEFESVEEEKCHLQEATAAVRLKNGSSDYKPAAARYRKLNDDQEYNQIFHVHNPNSSHRRDSILRPNRSAKIWLLVVIWSCLYYFGCCLYILFFTGIWLYLNTSHAFSRLGFELNYSNCIDYIIEYRQLNNNSNYYDGIYVPNVDGKYPSGRDPKVPRILPWTDPTTGFYHAVRIIIEFSENQFFIYDTMATVAAHTHFVCFIVVDMILNCQLIRKRLGVLIENLHRLRQFRATCYKNNANSMDIRANDHLRGGDEYLQSVERKRYLANDEETIETIELQSIIVDHFKLMINYNHYLAFHCSFVIILWLIYTLVVCIWIGISGSQSIQTEFYLLEGVATVFIIILLCMVAYLRSINLRLYPLVATVMALDENATVTKKDWIIVLKYFFPQPLYCFRIFGKTEISNLFILKVSRNSFVINCRSSS